MFKKCPRLVLRKKDMEFFTVDGETETRKRGDLPAALNLFPLTFSNEEWRPEVPKRYFY